MAEIDLEQAKSSEESGTLASLREKHRQSRQVLTGHPNDPALTDQGEDEELPKGKDVKPETEEVEPPQQPGEPQSKEEPQLVIEPDKKYRFSSQDEAEKAHAEAEKKMHEATSEVAELRKRLNENKKQPKEEAPKPTSEEVAVEMAKIWEEIDNLDPYDDEYYQQKALLTTKLLNLQKTETASEDASEVARQVAREELRAAREEEAVQKKKESEEKASRNAAVQMARESGLNMDDEVIDRLFWDSLQRAPYHESITLKEQVDFMVSEVKRLNAEKAKEKGASAPQQTVLERGSSTPVKQTPSEEETKPRTLGEIKDRWKQQRQI